MVLEPTTDDTLAILRGIKKYEVHHGVRIRDEALVAAVDLVPLHYGSLSAG